MAQRVGFRANKMKRIAATGEETFDLSLGERRTVACTRHNFTQRGCDPAAMRERRWCDHQPR